MDAIPSGVLEQFAAGFGGELFLQVLQKLDYADHAHLCCAARLWQRTHADWVRHLPRSAAELAHRGETVEGLHWLGVDHMGSSWPLLLYCSGFGAGSAQNPMTNASRTPWQEPVAQEGQLDLASELYGSRWAFCTEKSSTGGAGSNSHWMVTHDVRLEVDGVLLATSRRNGEVSNGSWTATEGCALTLRAFDHSWRIQLMESGIEMLGEGVAAFMVEEGEARRGIAERTPRVYLPFSNTNFSTMPSGGTIHGESVRTDFSKVRLLLPELRILCSDFTFSTATGSCYIIGSNGSTRTDYTHTLFGVAQGSCGPAAFSRIDLRGTPLAINAHFLPTGFRPRGKASHRKNGQLVLVAGTGSQGACAPTFPGTHEPQYPCLSDGHANQLWQQGQFKDKPIMIQLRRVSPVPDEDYGRCHDTQNAPVDWTIYGERREGLSLPIVRAS